MSDPFASIERFPRATLARWPSPLERAPNLAHRLGVSARLWFKRDDAAELAFGGNKVRQLEFYLGEAQSQDADTILITGAVQSNFVRSAAAAARKLGMDCHIQLEDRTPKADAIYRHSGNVLLDRLFGATLHSYPAGEDEEGADRRLHEIAGELRAAGGRPYVIPLGPGNPPLGALGYVLAAQEILAEKIAFDEVVTASGSGATHAGLLYGLRALGCEAIVTGVCVRRAAEVQAQRISDRCREIAKLLDAPEVVSGADVVLTDEFLAPGYGLAGEAAVEAMRLAARSEALITDPVYTAKSMAGFLARARQSQAGRNLLFIHTGGEPALFAYEPDLRDRLG